MTAPSERIFAAAPAGPLFDAELFARDFRATMQARNLSAREAAREIGVSSATVNRVTRGKTPDVETFLRISGWVLRNEKFVALTRGEMPCETCAGDIEACSLVPLRHCEKANRTRESTEAAR